MKYFGYFQMSIFNGEYSTGDIYKKIYAYLMEFYKILFHVMDRPLF